MNTLVKIIITAFAVIITSYILPGVKIDGFLTALIVAAVLSLLNIFIKPLLILLTIPITFYTFGLFLLVINAVIIIMTSSLVPGFKVDGFWWALAFSIILSVVRSLLESIDNKDNRQQPYTE
ncbi:MAG TPA: phage holin family protein [Bacteroidales bacterium]|nr:phage holin family protein [Bacteroidales bacterium]HPS16223.1 phage holin family protein [Bacteroidales bacterium]